MQFSHFFTLQTQIEAIFTVFRQIYVWLLYALPVYAVYQIIYGYRHLTEPWQTLSDVTGTFGNTGIFGGFLALAFVACLSLAAENKPLSIKWWLHVVPLSILLVMLIYSQSRAGWLAAAGGAVFILAGRIKYRGLRVVARNDVQGGGLRVKPAMTVCAGCVILIAVFLAFKLYSFKKDSADGRLLIWKVSTGLLAEKPVFGLGAGGFQANYMTAQAEYFRENPDSRFADLADEILHPFNEFLIIWIEHGLLGLAVALSAVCCAVFFAGSTFLPFRAVLLALAVFACFSYPLGYKEFCIVAMIGLTLIMLKHLVDFVKTVSLNFFACLKPAVCFVILLTAVLFLNGSPKTYASPSLKAVSELMRDSLYTEAIPQLEHIIEIYPNCQATIWLGEAYEQTGATDKALDAYTTASFMKPCLFEPHYRMAKLYLKIGDNARAKEKAELIVNKKIKVESWQINRLKREMRATLDSLNFIENEFINNNY